MSNLRARAFVPALFVQLFIALAISQHAFSQTAQTETQPVQPLQATAEKVVVKEEPREQSPTAPATAVLTPASAEQSDAGKETVAASQPLSFSTARMVKTGASRPFSFEANAEHASKSLNASDFFAQDSPGGAPQTTATPYTPLTSGEKMRRGFKAAFLTPQAYALPLLSAIITEWGEDDLPHKDTDDRVADGLSRFAIKFGRRSTNSILGGGVFPSLFRQDPRYDRPVGKGVGGRIAHAVSRVFVTRGDNGKIQPNYSRFAGQLSSSALSNLWEQSTPGHDRIGTDATFRRFGNSFISGMLSNVIREFAPDIKKIFGR